MQSPALDLREVVQPLPLFILFRHFVLGPVYSTSISCRLIFQGPLEVSKNILSVLFSYLFYFFKDGHPLRCEVDVPHPPQPQLGFFPAQIGSYKIKLVWSMFDPLSTMMLSEIFIQGMPCSPPHPLPRSFLTRTQRWQRRAAASSVWCRKRSISSSGQGCDIWPQGFNERLCVLMWGAHPIGHERARSFTPKSLFGHSQFERWKMASSRPNSLWICTCVPVQVSNHLHNPVRPPAPPQLPLDTVWESLSLC